jgi:hypothetical protein
MTFDGNVHGAILNHCPWVAVLQDLGNKYKAFLQKTALY